MKVAPSATVWFGISLTTGPSFTDVTVKVAASSSKSVPGSVARKVIVSAPFHVGDGAVMVATRLTSITTVNSALPEYVQLMSESGLSTSLT